MSAEHTFIIETEIISLLSDELTDNVIDEANQYIRPEEIKRKLNRKMFGSMKDLLSYK